MGDMSNSSWEELLSTLRLLSEKHDAELFGDVISKLEKEDSGQAPLSDGVRRTLFEYLVDQLLIHRELNELVRRQERSQRMFLAVFERLLQPLAGNRGNASEAEEKSLRKHLGLTRRQGEVLSWLMQGKRDSEIATILSISERTVHSHVTAVLKCLGCETRTAAASTARETLDEIRSGAFKIR